MIMCNDACQLIVHNYVVIGQANIASMAVTAWMVPVQLPKVLQSLPHLPHPLKEYLVCAAHIPSACSDQHRQWAH